MPSQFSIVVLLDVPYYIINLLCYSAVCGGRLTATSKAQELFSHAKYGDQNYDNKRSCDWLISAQSENYRVRFRFLTFEVEEESDCG